MTSGQPLAKIGNSGNTLEPHLHIGAAKDGKEIGLQFNGRSLSINSVISRKKEVHKNAINLNAQKRRFALLLRAGNGERRGQRQRLCYPTNSSTI